MLINFHNIPVEADTMIGVMLNFRRLTHIVRTEFITAIYQLFEWKRNVPRVIFATVTAGGRAGTLEKEMG